jgi:ElaB/YqjD/DUF883 family membrane-anchored ribosome-binding protein
MKSNKDTTHTPKELLHELQALVTEAESMIAGDGPDAAQSPDALDSLRSRFDAAQERFTDIYQGTRKRVVAGARYTDEAIRANPYQSLAIAAGVGVLVGVLLGRRSK